jgi:hypothetical protein
MQNLDLSRFRQSSIVHMQWRMLKAPYAWMTAHRRAQIRKVFQQIDVVERPIGKALSRPGVIPPGPTHDLFQVS